MPPTTRLVTGHLVLDPLRVDDAAEMAGVLADPALYLYTGGEPPTEEVLVARYRSQVDGSGNDAEVWHNWIVRDHGKAVGFVQASVSADTAALAWVIGVPWQGRGIATEAAAAVRDWLAGEGIHKPTAFIHPENKASNAVAAKLGLASTGVLDDEGEMTWE